VAGRQQTADSRQQTADNKQHGAESGQQKVDSRQNDVLVGMDDELGLFRGLVGVIDASEVLNETGACLLVQALDMELCYYTVAKLLLHCCQTVVTLLPNCCYTVAKLLLHCCQTVVTLLPNYYYTVAKLLLQCCQTCYNVVAMMQDGLRA
jgi:hypothetical protein